MGRGTVGPRRSGAGWIVIIFDLIDQPVRWLAGRVNASEGVEVKKKRFPRPPRPNALIDSATIARSKVHFDVKTTFLTFFLSR